MSTSPQHNNGGGGFNPLSAFNDALNIINVAHGGGVPGESPTKSVSNLAKQEKTYAPAPVKTALNAAGTVGSIGTFFTSTKNWLRLGEILAGALLLLFGLMQLGGSSATGTARSAARTVR